MSQYTHGHPLALVSIAASEDMVLLDQWERHLQPLKQAGLITFWSGRHLAAGADRVQAFQHQFDTADLILLLLSADFFASPDCLAMMEHSLEHSQTGAVQVVPLLLRSVAWQESSLNELLSWPPNGKPIILWSDQDEGWHACVQELRRLLGRQISCHLPASPAEKHADPLWAGLPKQDNLVNNLPANFVARSQEFELLKRSLMCEPPLGVTAITSVLLGAGGYGKTTLALALCHDRDIRERFRDGILWVTLGDQSTNLISKIEDLVYFLNRERPGVNSVEAASAILRDTLADHRYLLVIDDVWRSSDLQPFLQGAPLCARLITTRADRVVPPLARHVAVDAMHQDEAIQLLQSGIEVLQGDKNEKVAFQQLASRLGEWPLLLTLANSILHERINRLHEPLSSALTFLQRALDKRGVVAFDAKNASKREDAVAQTLEISLAQLDASERERYEELAIFPENSNIPLATASLLWQTTGNFDDLDTEELCQRLYSLSLLLVYDLSSRHIRLHDVVRWYLQGKGMSRLPILHRRFLDSYALARWADLSPHEPYLWEHLAEHLLAAERQEALITTVKDLHYISAKVLIKGVSALEQDLNRAVKEAPDNTELILLKRHVVRMAHLLQLGQTQRDVEGIFLSRFSQIEGLHLLSTKWRREAPHPWLSAWYPLPELRNSALIRTLEGHTSAVNDCAISPDGSWLVSASSDKTLKIWDALTGEERFTLEGHTDDMNGCAISPDGSWLASTSSDKTLKIWDTSTGKEHLTLEGHTDAVSDCTFSPNGSWLVSASHDKTLKIWSVSTGKEHFTFTGEVDWVSSCTFSSVGTWLASTSFDKTLTVRSVSTCLTLTGHTHWVSDCAISPDGSWLVSASHDKTLKIWSVSTGEERFTLEGHTGVVNGCAISPDGSWLVSASDDGTLKIWDPATGEGHFTLGGHDWVSDCAISPDGSWLVSASADGTLKIWDTSTGEERFILEEHLEENIEPEPVRGCAISPDGSWLVSRYFNGTLKIWDTSTGKERFTLEGRRRGLSWVSDCAISPDGSWLVFASQDKTLKICDTSTGKERFTLEGHTEGVISCAISPDGSWLVSASADGTLKIWDALTGKECLTLEGHTERVNGCAISSDGTWLVSASSDKTLKIWDASTGKERFTLEGHTDWVSNCTVSPDGSWLVSVSSDKTLKIWDASTGKERFTLEGHTDWVSSCVISPDGSWLASTSLDQTLKVWNTQHGHCVATFYSGGSLFTCAIHPDGEHLIAAGQVGLSFLRVIW